jgi:diguanylate cyclase (GGDEF)-like protein
MPLLSIAVALGFAITGYLRSSVFSPVEVWSLLVLIATAVVRQSVALYANSQMRRRLEYQTVHDDLTGLKNRRFLRALLDSSAPELDAASWQLLMIDLDDFKSINDSFGHSVGDALLVEISRLLRSAVRSTDVIAHLGGDEFAVAVHGDRVDATDVARRILSALDDPIPLGDITARVGASIGVVTSDGAPTAEVLLRNADLAMYAAKAQGGHQFTLYTPSMHQAVAERVHLEAELRAGWNTEQLIVHFQPIVELATGRVVSMEALVRWQHPERGLIAPDSFIPIAEETGLIVPLGERILRMSCNALATLQRRHPTARDISVSVNVSARQLRSVHLVKTVSEALRSSGLHPGQLTLEVTETAVIRDLDHSIRILNDLRALGVRIALDDFGVGNASIGNLRRLPVDVIKIDKSLVDHIPDGRMATGLLDAVAAMASALNLRTVIEGVERSDQAAHLREAGYDMAQGYYFARPADAVAIDRILVRGFLEGTDAVQTGHRTAPGSGTEATETMLVVEDEDLLAVIVRRLLANEGIRAVTARTLAEARAALETTAYAAVLTDITLPDGIGWDLVEELRARKATANTPIVVMTAIPDDADVLNRAMRLRCEYLGKPFQGPALLAKLAKARARSGSGEVLVRTRASRPSIVAAAAL